MNYNILFEDNEITNTKMYLNDTVCPCCGKKLKLVDPSKNEYNNTEFIKVNESMLNENKLADYLLDIIESEAMDIYKNELETNVPETDITGEIIDSEYGDRFIYVNKELKKVIKTKANAIANMIKQQGIEVSPFYIENEIFQLLKAYSYIGKR